MGWGMYDCVGVEGSCLCLLNEYERHYGDNMAEKTGVVCPCIMKEARSEILLCQMCLELRYLAHYFSPELSYQPVKSARDGADALYDFTSKLCIS